MNRILSALLVAVGIAVSVPVAETVTATSVPFTFPAVSRIKAGIDQAGPAYFTYSQASMRTGTVRISWRLPSDVKKGSRIAVYSLSGKLVESFGIDSRNGVVEWKFGKQAVAGGVYLARLSSGSYKKNLKIFLVQ